MEDGGEGFGLYDFGAFEAADRGFDEVTTEVFGVDDDVDVGFEVGGADARATFTDIAVDLAALVFEAGFDCLE